MSLLQIYILKNTETYSQVTEIKAIARARTDPMDVVSPEAELFLGAGAGASLVGPAAVEGLPEAAFGDMAPFGDIAGATVP